MRLLVMFDVPTETDADKKNYRKLVKALEMEGFYRLQYSVYVRVCANQADVSSCIIRLRSRVARFDGKIKAVTFTDMQFARMQTLNYDVTKSSDIRSLSKRLLII